jgi:BASS family bile acid:Na+ symporter
VPVPMGAMLFSILKIVIAPVAAGVILNHLLGRYLGGVRAVFPGISVGAIVVIIAIVVALNTHHDAFIVFFMIIAVILHNSLGLAAGYAVLMFLGYDQRTCRTLAIEVGMQNSGLAVALATQFFSPAAALPGAIFSIWHNLSGSAVAAFWARRPVEGDDEMGAPN